MIIFLFGEDDWRRDEKKREIIAQFSSKNPEAGIKNFDFEQDSSETELLSFLSQNSLFAPKRMAIIESFGENQKGKEIFKDFLEDKFCNILISSNKKPGKPFQFLAEKPCVSEEFSFLDGAKWKNFLKKQAEIHGAEIEPAALDFLASLFEGDTWRGITEIQKLSSMKKVGMKELESLALEASPDYFGTVQRIKSRSLKDRLTGLYYLLAKNDPAAKLFNILASLWYEKKSQFAAEDLRFKSGKLEYEEALLEIVLS